MIKKVQDPVLCLVSGMQKSPPSQDNPLRYEKRAYADQDSETEKEIEKGSPEAEAVGEESKKDAG